MWGELSWGEFSLGRVFFGASCPVSENCQRFRVDSLLLLFLPILEKLSSAIKDYSLRKLEEGCLGGKLVTLNLKQPKDTAPLDFRQISTLDTGTYTGL